MLVKPPGDILDLRTPITGITAADLEGVTATRKAAAGRLAALLGPRVVLVGHSLSADLAALQVCVLAVCACGRAQYMAGPRRGACAATPSHLVTL